MKEFWKPVKGYEGIYEVSNLGKVKSLSRNMKSCFGYTAHRREKLKATQIDKQGYLVVQLYKNSKLKTKKVHRLVAAAFIPNKDNLPCINHKDENKQNNFVFVNTDGTIDIEKSNLEWCTHKYNSNYGTAIERTAIKSRKKIAKYDKDGNLLEKYNSIREAAIANNLSESGISSNSHKDRGYKIYGGFIWKRIN